MLLTTGIGAWVEEDYYDRTGRLDLDNLNDRIHINMFAGDAHLETQTLLLKVFVDFEAVPFKVAGMDDYVLTFIFETPTQHRITIPIHLYSGLIDTGYNRNFTVLSAVYPQYYMHQELDFLQTEWGGGIHFNWGMVLNLELNLGHDEIVLQADIFENIVHTEGFGGFELNQNFDVYDNFDAYHSENEDGTLVFTQHPPPRHLEVRLGESLKLAFTINLHPGLIELVTEDGTEYIEPPPLTEMVMIILVDWNQVEIEGNPYLFIQLTDEQVEKRYGQFGIFHLALPEEVGFYDVVAFVVERTQSGYEPFTFFPSAMSGRFTIEVVE